MEEEEGGPVLVIGGGGHALVTIEVLRDAGHDIIGALTREGRPTDGLDRLDVEVLGTDEELAVRIREGAQRLFVAVGDNRDRRRLTDTVISAGGRLVRAISPNAVVSASARVDEGVLVMPGAIVNALATVSPGAIINTRASIDHECHVGAHAHVAPGAVIAGGVNVGEGALIGVGAGVLPFRTVGAWAIVGAGATVTDDVPAGATVTGVPARTRR